MCFFVCHAILLRIATYVLQSTEYRVDSELGLNSVSVSGLSGH